MAGRRDVLTAAAVALLVVAVDQATKLWAQQALSPGREVTVIDGWLWFKLISNSGASLGLLRGAATGGVGAAALGAVGGGTTSNLLDRVRLGSVIDFIEVHGWPTNFNLADAAIRVGVVLFLLALLLRLRRHPR